MSMTFFDNTKGIKDAVSAYISAEILDGTTAEKNSVEFLLETMLIRESQLLATNSELHDSMKFSKQTRELMEKPHNTTAISNNGRPSVFNTARTTANGSTDENLTMPSLNKN